MQFNSINISIFNEYFAFCRLKHHSGINDIPEIAHMLPHVGKEINYNEGETYCNKDEFWYNYPKHIAIIIDDDSHFMLQTVNGNKVGKLYRRIEENEKEIRAFFDENKGNIVLLENKPSARSIKPDYDSLILYTEKKAEVNKLNEEYNQVYRECRRKGYDLDVYQKDHSQDIDSEKYNYLICLASKISLELAKARNVLDKIQDTKLQDLTLPISKEEAYSITFALLYNYYLKHKNRRSLHSHEFRCIFHDFISKHPEAIDYFCKSTGKQFNKNSIVSELEKDNIIPKLYDSVADEILS